MLAESLDPNPLLDHMAANLQHNLGTRRAVALAEAAIRKLAQHAQAESLEVWLALHERLAIQQPVSRKQLN